MLVTGDLLAAPAKGDRDVLEDSRATLETAMNDVTDRAENLMNIHAGDKAAR